MTLPRRRVALIARDSAGFGDGAEPSADGASLPVVTMVIPTKNEAECIDAVFERTERALASFPAEIMIVDDSDSDDDTPRLVAARQVRSETPVQLLHRPVDERGGGLGGAVLAGMRCANAPWVCVMDADLQHPPEVIPLLLNRANVGDVDLVIASRNTVGQQCDGLSRWRQFVSDGCTYAARFLFRQNLRGVHDPMSGFFLVRLDALDLDVMQPRGFKVLLEILVRHPSLRTAEVPFEFAERSLGTSKASAQEGFNYLLLVSRLWLRQGPGRLLRLGTG
jgi:dolichol-phosphate mannosyltransferase